MTWIGYAASIWVLLTYWVMAEHGDVRPFHWANAVGGPILVATTLATVGWVPLLTLTITFSLLGMLGLWRTR